MLTTLTLVAALFLALPTALLLLIAMVPTVVACIVDLTPGRYACRCVGALNFAGAIPFVLKLWAGSHTVPQAMSIVADPFSLLAMYSAAAVGWMIFHGVPGIVAALKSFNERRAVEMLQARQRALVEEWGRAVTGARDDSNGAAAAN
jgi:hypothetical protein